MVGNFYYYLQLSINKSTCALSYEQIQSNLRNWFHGSRLTNFAIPLHQIHVPDEQ